MNPEREACARELRQLAEWAAATPASSIPREVLSRCARVIADDVAAIVGARDEPEVRRFHEKRLSRKDVEESTVFRGGRSRISREAAASANAVAADWLELDEGYRPTSCHAGLYVLPSLLAEAEAIDLRLEEVLRALALGYEITTRVARAWAPAGMQPHGRYSAIGATAGLCLARGSSGQFLAEALGTAATLAGAGLRTHLAEGILARNIWPAAGASSGFLAVESAECGIAGATTAFHDVFTVAFGGRWNKGALTEGLGGAWAVLDGYTKIYACCQHLHSAVEAAIGMRPALLARIRLDEIEAIEVETHALALPLADRHPRTSLGGKFSMPHAIATTLVTGSAGADAFSAAKLGDPAIAGLREKVTVAAWTPQLPPPNDRPARITVLTRGGSKLQGECLSAAGGPDRPLPPVTVFEKLSELAVPVYPSIRRVLEDLAELPSSRMQQGWRRIVDEMCA